MAAFRVGLATLCLTVALAAGCSKAPGDARSRADSALIRAEVDSVMRSHFGAFERGDIAGWSGILADDVFFTAAEPGNVFVGRDSVREKMQRDIGRVLEAGVTLAMRPVTGRIWIWIAGDSRTAGATYDLDCTVSYDNQRLSYRLRSSYLLEQDTTGWRVLAAQYSRPASYDTLFMSLMSRRVRGVAAVGDQVPPEAGDLVQRFRADLRDISQASIAAAAIIVTPGSIVDNGDNGRRELVQWLGPADNAGDMGDGIRAGLNRSGTIGWVATNLRVPVFAGPESATAPMRAFFVYRRSDSRWEIVQVSLSVGLSDQL